MLLLLLLVGLSGLAGSRLITKTSSRASFSRPCRQTLQQHMTQLSDYSQGCSRKQQSRREKTNKHQSSKKLRCQWVQWIAAGGAVGTGRV
jgi:amino acid permease